MRQPNAALAVPTTTDKIPIAATWKGQGSARCVVIDARRFSQVAVVAGCRSTSNITIGTLSLTYIKSQAYGRFLTFSAMRLQRKQGQIN
jgi:hypothetical protein